MAGPERIALVEEHKVKRGESLKSLAEANGLTWQELAKFNWGTSVPDEINKHLRDDVGCTKKTPDGYNYSFDDSDKPGIIYIPRKWARMNLALDEAYTIRVRRIRNFLVILENEEGQRIPETEYEAALADGSVHKGRLGLGGVDAIKNPPEGAVDVKFPDLDDIEAKSLAAAVREGFDDRDPRELHRLFRYPPETVQRVFAAYDRYFNDYHGKGLRHDIEREFFNDADARMVLYACMSRAGMGDSASQAAEQEVRSDG